MQILGLLTVNIKLKLHSYKECELRASYKHLKQILSSFEGVSNYVTLSHSW
jgi:hypothetical protein